MCDDFIHPGLIEDPRLSRRGFAAMAAVFAGALTTGFARETVDARDVAVTTPDGSCDAVLIEPLKSGRFPVVLVWPDIMGLRPVFRTIGARLASLGYVVLIPNPFYRSAHAPVIGDNFNFNDQEQRTKLFALRKAMSDDGVDRDARAYLAFLDAQPKADPSRAAGVQGYCMGGSLAFRTAAVQADRVRAVASFHGGNALVTKEANSPHLLIPKTSAAFLVCQAQNDDAQQPEVKDVLRKSFADAGRSAVVEVYQADHGWCVPGGQTYDQSEAERAWRAMVDLYRTNLSRS